MKYTSGPWKSAFVETGWGLVSQENGKCIVFAEREDGGTLPTEANARVLEAAPELLEAAVFAVWSIVGVLSEKDISPEMRTTLTDAKAQLEFAIATAEGGK